MRNLPQLVIDASVVTRWYLTNPPFVKEALRIRDHYQAGQIGLTAPANFRFEVSGGIHRAVTTRALPASEVASRLSDFLALPIPLVDDPALIMEAHRLSIRLSSSFYDSLYLALADSLDLPFVHADGRLRSTLRGRISRELWIEDY